MLYSSTSWLFSKMSGHLLFMNIKICIVNKILLTEDDLKFKKYKTQVKHNKRESFEETNWFLMSYFRLIKITIVMKVKYKRDIYT